MNHNNNYLEKAEQMWNTKTHQQLTVIALEDIKLKHLCKGSKMCSICANNIWYGAKKNMLCSVWKQKYKDTIYCTYVQMWGIKQYWENRWEITDMMGQKCSKLTDLNLWLMVQTVQHNPVLVFTSVAVIVIQHLKEVFPQGKLHAEKDHSAFFLKLCFPYNISVYSPICSFIN